MCEGGIEIWVALVPAAPEVEQAVLLVWQVGESTSDVSPVFSQDV